MICIPGSPGAFLKKSCSTHIKLSSTRRSQSTMASKKPFFITTPIFYVNAQPHIGHLYTLVLTDVITRYQESMGRTAIMLTGTDEHGMKIQAAAKAAGKTPQIFCDEVSAVFRDLPQRANVQYDQFIRTTSPEHKTAVTHFWNVLLEKGYIFKASHSGWYSISDETFFPSTAVEERVNQSTGQKAHYSTETGNLVQWTAETNYHFRLSAMKGRLLEFYAANETFVTPSIRYDDVVTAVTEGLQDLSISRPSSRLTWGIPVPGDESQTIYVWLDALVNYITAAGYPNTTSMWPADVHVIGKDIIRFHCIYWPAFLLAADIEPPKSVLSHSHWTMGSLKMSKSRGNVVDPWQAIERFGADSVRYYLMRDGRLENDGNYSTEHLILRHNHELVNGLGNLISRVTAKTFDLDSILVSPPELSKYQSQIGQLVRQTGQLINSFHFNMNKNLVYKAVADVADMIANSNAILQLMEPWSKSCVEKTKREVLYATLENARIATLLLQPIMPDATTELLNRLGVPQNARTLAYAEFSADKSYRPVKEKFAHVFTSIDDGTKSMDASKKPKNQKGRSSKAPAPAIKKLSIRDTVT